MKVVAIDGPVGVGKSTVAAQVAAELGFRHLDTGAMYRVVAWKLMQLPVEQQDNHNIMADLAYRLRISLGASGEVTVDGHDVTDAIRDEAVSRFVSRVADVRTVREALVAQQRRIGSERPAVLEGRDIGTVVFPDAACKIYLDASPEVRVERRVAQLRASGRNADRAEVRANLMERDARDRVRPWGALRVAEDATIVDSTCFDEARVVEIICALVRENPVFGLHGVAAP
ncbi:(d)CMP kinase [bacterium]|nr:(d)CMP kinase [bacterium]